MADSAVAMTRQYVRTTVSSPLERFTGTAVCFIVHGQGVERTASLVADYCLTILLWTGSLLNILLYFVNLFSTLHYEQTCCQ